MTTDTSAEALERLANGMGFEDQGVHYEAMIDVILALASEKRRAREGVTDDVVERAYRAFYRIADDNIQITSLWPIEQWRAALEAVWPDGLDAKDAARYRWLRTHFRFANDSMHELWFDAQLEPDDSGIPSDLDMEIDAAMRGTDHD